MARLLTSTWRETLLVDPVSAIGKIALQRLHDLGAYGLYLYEIAKQTVQRPMRWELIFQQLEFIGNHRLISSCLQAFLPVLYLPLMVLVGEGCVPRHVWLRRVI
jgi:hypothetical protein